MLSDKKIDVDEAYSSSPWWYDVRGFFILTFSYNDTLWSLTRFFSRNFSKTHLEVAIGSGSFFFLNLLVARLLRGIKAEGIGCDYAPSMLAGAGFLFNRTKSWRIQKADVECLPYKDDSFETVNVANAFHCFHNPEKAIEEIFRVTRKGGTVAINVHLYPEGTYLLRKIAEAVVRWGIKKGILVTPFTREEITRIVERRPFTILESFAKGNDFYLLLKKI